MNRVVFPSGQNTGVEDVNKSGIFFSRSPQTLVRFSGSLSAVLHSVKCQF